MPCWLRLDREVTGLCLKRRNPQSQSMRASITPPRWCILTQRVQRATVFLNTLLSDCEITLYPIICPFQQSRATPLFSFQWHVNKRRRYRTILGCRWRKSEHCKKPPARKFLFPWKSTRATSHWAKEVCKFKCRVWSLRAIDAIEYSNTFGTDWSQGTAIKILFSCSSSRILCMVVSNSLIMRSKEQKLSMWWIIYSSYEV